MKWHYKSNNKYFNNKFAAIDEFENTRNNLLLEVPDSYTNYDFTIEPKEDISDLLKNEAFAVREQNNYIRLFYSGGADSQAVLNAFVDNNIYINEIVCFKSGFVDADYEIDNFAIPYLNKIKDKLTDTKIRILSPSIADYEQWYNGDWTSKYFNHDFTSTVAFFRLMDQPYNFDDGALNIKGKDKPKIIKHKGRLYTYISDSISEIEHNVYHFLMENPAILSKQCHMLINQFKNDTDQFNSFFQRIDSQNNANTIIHRNLNNDLPEKQKHYFTSDAKLMNQDRDMFYVNEKERLALLNAIDLCPKILDRWIDGVEEIQSSRFSKWFNYGRPEFGTTGILSKFFCLTDGTVTTVDNLYPTGFTTENIIAHA